MYGLKPDWIDDDEEDARFFTLQDYEGAKPRWCSGCGDLPVLASVQRICRNEQLKPENTVIVSGIGCSSRFPHYMHTYGFHGLHGRALPLACGVRSRREDLNIFVATGDGDCCAIGAGHWIHAIRYNMKMVIMLFDNNIYGLTKKQTSPTTRKGKHSNTHPDGNTLPALNPLTVTLGITNASFVAQAVDWNPPLLYAILHAAYKHPGTAFVRILQRCPHFTAEVFEPCLKDASNLKLLTHPDGIQYDKDVLKLFPVQEEHDPSDLRKARDQAEVDEPYPIGLLYRNAECDRYDTHSQRGVGMSRADKIKGVNKQLDRFQI